MEDKELLISRIKDLDRVSYERGLGRHSQFLSLSEQNVFHSIEKELMCRETELSGGHEDADRCMIIWKGIGDEAPIACVKAVPVSEKYSDDLTHRDYLGALMNLGIERDCLGDILIRDNTAYVFCSEGMADFICDQLTRVKHTNVVCNRAAFSECSCAPELKDLKVNIASERIDAIIAAVFKLSRSAASGLMDTEQVFIDGRTARGCGVRINEGSRISVRGHGKFIYGGISHESRKGRLFVSVKLFV